MKVVIAGAHGFVARHLRREFAEAELILLSRRPREGEFFWDPAKGILEEKLVAHADLVINLAGESIRGRWTAAKKESIAQSRFQATALLVERLQKAPPSLYLGASAVGYYGVDRGNECLTEGSSSGEGFLAQVCLQWEKLHQQLTGTRVVCLRFGAILAPDGGLLATLLPLFRAGLGGVIGTGNQWMSLVSLRDVCGICRFCIETSTLSGVLNVTAPETMTNREWTLALSKALHRPTLCPVPRWLLNLVLGESASLAWGSQRVLPARLLMERYSFRDPSPADALC